MLSCLYVIGIYKYDVLKFLVSCTTYISEVPGSILYPDTRYPDLDSLNLRGIHVFLETCIRIIVWLDHDCFLQNP
jgi:hypothetical protein